MESIVSKLKKSFGKEKSLKVVVFIGVLGILLILVSEFFPSKSDKAPEKTDKASLQTTQESGFFQKETENKLCEILSTIKGVGKVEVMLNVCATEESVFAQENKQQKSSDSDKNSIDNENKYVIIEEGGDKKALVKKVLNPEISGAVIVCEGGDNAKTCESIYKTVSTALGIPISKIYVAKLK
ncbi:MAG: hypothetical protein RR540_06250 [Oscillospiraceae bacterium]